MVRRRPFLERLLGYLSDLSLLEKVAYLVSLPIVGGIFFVVVERPPPVTGRGMVFPSTRTQTVSELILSSLGYALASSGFYLIFSAKRHLHNPRYATFQVLAGSLIVALSIMYLAVMYGMKT